MNFEFATAARLIFGQGSIRQLADLSQTFGSRVFIVTGKDSSRTTAALQQLTESGRQLTHFSILAEPTLEEIRLGASIAQKTQAQLVIGIGGGSAIDAGKAIAAIAQQPEDIMHYLEVIGKGQPLTAAPLPYIAIPTTAGTGAEVTRNAVLSSTEHGVKVSLRHAAMLPQIALVDPELALHCPPHITATSGMDALTQCLEAYVSCRAQPMTDALCRDGIQRAVRSLELVVSQGHSLPAREDMALAALFSGIALANAGLGAVHGFASPIGGQFRAPHGAICAALLAPVWESNLEAVRRIGSPETAARFQSAAALLTQDPAAEPEAALPYLRALTQRLNIPKLHTWGIKEEHLADIATKAAQASSMKGNPVPLTHSALIHALRGALDSDSSSP